MNRRQEEIAMLEMWWTLAPLPPDRDILAEFRKVFGSECDTSTLAMRETSQKPTVKTVTRSALLRRLNRFFLSSRFDDRCWELRKSRKAEVPELGHYCVIDYRESRVVRMYCTLEGLAAEFGLLRDGEVVID